MKSLTALVLSMVLVLTSVNAAGNGISLVKKGVSQYKIVLADNAGRWDSLAALELQKYIIEISGAVIEITAGRADKAVIIGMTDAREPANKKLKEDGYRIKTAGNNLHIQSGGGRGSLNGVYSFLEKYLNCRMYTSEIIKIPKNKNIFIPEVDITENPVFEYRDINYKESWNIEFARWHKLHSDKESKKIWGMFVHTFDKLVPPDKYFKEHPEYYAELNGIRVPDSQLCLTNNNVFKIVIEELKKKMAENPGAKIWSVSQNDNFSNCRCEECRKIDEAEGAPSGSLLNFVNQVAREFPDKIISTLAYQYTRKAPKNIKPEKNVNIMFCSIECNRSKPLETDPSSTDFIRDLKEWSAVTNNIFIWDYVVQFRNTVSPFPNFHVLQANIKLFEKYHAKMMFQQGAGGCTGYEFGELRNYIIAKLLWNPDINVNSIMNDFLNGYYGKAGKYIRKYIDLMTGALVKSGEPLLIYGNPVSPMKHYLSAAMIKKYNSLFEEAERIVKGDSDLEKRVKIARLPLKYAMLEQAKVIGTGEYGIVIRNNDGSYSVNDNIKNLLNEFYEESKLTGKLVVNESQVTADDYKNVYESLLAKTMKNPLGLNKSVKLLTAASSKYPANGAKTLTDGFRGVDDYNFNWLGFEAEDLEAVVDLEKSTTVKKVSIDFLQDNNSWVFMPKEVEISYSDDGLNYKTAAVIKNTVPEEKGKAFIETFSAEVQNINARYIKVKGVNMKVCPRWHKGHPGKAWVFADEIVIE